MSSRGIVWSGSVVAVLAVAAVAGAYFVYPDFFQPPTVTTAAAIRAPVSEAIYGTGTVEPERWAKVVPLQRRRLVELCRCEGQAVKAGQVLGRQDDAEERSALNQLEINNEQLERDLNRALLPKKYASMHSCSARRWMEWCCVATAKLGRLLGQPTCCFG